MKAAITILIWAWQLACLYAWEILGMEGAGNLLTAWLVVCSFVATLGLFVADHKDMPAPNLLTAISPVYRSVMLVALIWFGHGFLGTLYALTWACVAAMRLSAKKHQAEGYGLG